MNLPTLTPHQKTQLSRFVRLLVFAVVPQLLAAAADPRGLSLKAVGAIVTAGLETVWRQINPAVPPSAS